MMFKELLGDAFSIIEKTAPMVASVIGSPAAGIGATVAVHLIGNALGVDPNDQTALVNAISHPDASTALAKVEENFGSWLKSGSLLDKLPAKLEINLKLEWDRSTQSCN